MSTPLHGIIRLSELLGRVVLDPSTASEIGSVDRLWLDPRTHQIIGISCLSGLVVIHQQSLSWSQIDAIGAEGLVARTISGVQPTKPDFVVTEIGQEVWTDAGNRIGTLTDYRIDLETGDVLDYLFTPSGWRGITEGTYRFAPSAIVSMNNQRMLITAAAAQAAEPFGGGLKQSVAQLADVLKEDYARTQQDLHLVADRLQSSTQKAAERLKAKLADTIDQFQSPAEEEPAPRRLDDAEAETLEAEVLDSERLRSPELPAPALDPFEPIDQPHPASMNPTDRSSEQIDPRKEH